MRTLSLIFVAGLASFLAVGASGLAQGVSTELVDFTDRYCSSCHNDTDKEGGLDLTALRYEPGDPTNFLTWVKVHDRLQAGEMPPKEKARPDSAAQTEFLRGLATKLTDDDRRRVSAEGRATRRRLNRAEYENALRDLLGAPWLNLRDQLPEDGAAHNFDKVSEALDVSHVHLTRYMSVAEYALHQVMSAQLERPASSKRRLYARENLTFGNQDGNPDRGRFPVFAGGPARDVLAHEAPLTVGDRAPERRELEAMAWTSSNYVAGFNSIWNSWRVPATGRYRLRFSGYSIWVGPNGIRRPTRTFLGQTMPGRSPFEIMPQPAQWFRPNHADVVRGRRSEPIVVYAIGGPTNRRLGEFDVKPDPGVSELDEVWLVANELLVTDAVRFFRSRPTDVADGYTNPLAQRDGVPGVAFRWMEIEGPVEDSTTAAGYRLLFGDRPMRRVETGGVSVPVVLQVPARRADGFGGPDGGRVMGTTRVEVTAQNPVANAEGLLRGFVQRAYRRPVQEREIQRFLGLVRARLEAGLGFAGAMLAGYVAVLASPEFIFVDDQPGRLDDYALATRLALFLWNSEPDEALRARAARGELRRPGVLREETERLLADSRSARFVSAFLDYWLELRRMTETTPSITIYNDYYLDDILTESAVAETRLYFGDLLRRNLPARHVVDADFAFLNDRLAAHYGIAGVEGVRIRRVTLPAGSVRGGLLTQASVLKVTANGTTTSPVVRGKWVMERIAGFEMPPPPAAVPAVEPDIRGAVTIRQQLDKHRADEACAVCHRKIDPPGFALENFDVLGGWRERYRATAIDQPPARGFGKNGWPFVFHLAQPIDASGQLADGRAFQDGREFKALLLRDETQLARNLARQLVVYATGAKVGFSDRAEIEAILQRAKPSQYGVRSLVTEIVQSELFRSK